MTEIRQAIAEQKVPVKQERSTHPPLTVNKLILILAAYYTLVFNYTFISAFEKAIMELDTFSIGFAISVPFFLFFTLSLTFSLFTVKYITKPFFITVTVLSSTVFYASLMYGIVFDYTMIQNIYETDNNEASTYINFAAVMFITLTGILPAYAIYKIKINYQSTLQTLKSKGILILMMLVGILIIAFTYYQNYASVLRNHSQLKRMIVPTYYLGSSVKFFKKEFFTAPIEYQVLGTGAKVIKPEGNNKPNLVVVVIGETARAMNYSYNGYQKSTNSYTQDQEIISFQNVSSCGTTTAVSLPCMFSDMTRENYDSHVVKHRDNVLDIIEKSGIEVSWIENNSGCKGICSRIDNFSIPTDSEHELCDGDYCFDERLLSELEKKIAQTTQNDKLIILHLIGSHGPAYYRRYPQEYRKFSPDCPRSDIQNCTKEALVNTYDNTISYTDYVLSKVIEQLKVKENEFNSSMLYISDHGESLGENGLYLHGLPYSIAPDHQIKVPLLLWLPDGFSKSNDINRQCIINNAKVNEYTHDNLYHSLISIMNIQTNDYNQDLDIFSDCRSTRSIGK
jgi:lipid A ethanolaminephosphotransferase